MKLKDISVYLQFSQSIKIYNIFHLNFLGKVSPDLFTCHVNKLSKPIIINNKKNKKLKRILIQEVLEKKSNLR